MKHALARSLWTIAGVLVFLGYACVLCLGVMTFNVGMEPRASPIFQICWWSMVGLSPVFGVSLYLYAEEKW